MTLPCPRFSRPLARAVVASIVVLCVPGTTDGQEAPWKERWELNLVPQLGLAPTTSERLAATEILLVHANDLTSNPQTGGYDLAVHPWDTWNGGTTVPGDPDNWPFCHDDDPFYGQPTPGRGCSGFLVAPDLVVTAGHCIAGDPPDSKPPYDCGHRYVVFDYAAMSDTDPLGEEWLGGPVALPGDQVVQCDTVLVDTHIISEPPDPLEVFLQPPLSSGDWALLQLAETVDERLPVPIERFAQTAVDDPILVLGHPARIPVKGEITQVTGQTTGSFLHALGGSSGSPIFNLDTGKIAGVLTSSGVDAWANLDEENQCVDLCFECPGTLSGGTPATLFTADVPAIGVQVSQVVTSVDHYGPPTSALDYEPWPLTLSVPNGSLPPEIPEVTWSIHHDDGGPEWFEVASGPSAGTLGDGQSVAVTVLPADWLVSEPGLYEKALPVFDYTYGTRDPFLHRAHVGVDGYTLFPTDDFDGPQGLGVPHGASREYAPANRWVVTQDLTVTADVPWIELNGQDGTIPLYITLPCKYCGAPLETVVVSTSGYTMLPGVYTGTVTFSSDDSGTPPYELTTDVRFDHCREKTADLTLPLLNIRLDPGETHEQSLNVFTTSGNVIVDADTIIEVRPPGPGSTDQAKYTVRLISPDGTDALLKNFDDAPQVVYDDETAPPPGQLLSRLDEHSSIGDWKLELQNDPQATKTLKLELHRWEVRLHLQDAPSCEPCEFCGD